MKTYLPHEAGQLVRDILFTSQEVLWSLGAGGCLTDFAGNAYGNKKGIYDPKHRFEVIAAATPELNAKLRAMIKPA